MSIPREVHLLNITIANSPILLAISNMWWLSLANDENASSGISSIILVATEIGVVISDSDNLPNLPIAVIALSIAGMLSSWERAFMFCIL